MIIYGHFRDRNFRRTFFSAYMSLSEKIIIKVQISNRNFILEIKRKKTKKRSSKSVRKLLSLSDLKLSISVTF